MKKKLVSILLSLSMCAAYAMPLAAAGPEAPEAPEVVETAAPMATDTPSAIQKKGDLSRTFKYNGHTTSEMAFSVYVNKQGTSGATNDDGDPDAAAIEWSSTNTKVATVEQNDDKKSAKVNILGAGTVKIKAKATGIKTNNTVEYSLTVLPRAITGGAIEWTKPTTYFKDIAAFKSSFNKIKKGVMSNLVIKDSSGEDEHALVRDQDYVLSVSGSGAFTKSGKSVQIKIVGKNNYDKGSSTTKSIDVNFYAQNVTYGKTNASMTFGDTDDTFNDYVVFDGVSLGSIENAAEKAVQYKSSDKSKVSVDKNGKLTAKGVGKAVITAIPKNNKGAKQPSETGKKYTVTVTAKSITSDDIVFDVEKNIKLAKVYKDPAAFKAKFIDKANGKFVIKDKKTKLKGGSSKDFVVSVSGGKIEELNADNYDRDKAENVNRVNFKIEGKGKYKGTITGSFVVPLQAQGIKGLKDKTDSYDEFDGNAITFGEKYNLLELLKIDDDSYRNFTVPEAMKEKCKKIKFEPASSDIKINKNGIMTIKKVPSKPVEIKVSPAKNSGPKTISTVSIDISKANINEYTVKFKVPKGKENDTAVQSAFNKSSVKLISDKGKKLKNGTDFEVGTVKANGGTLTVEVKAKSGGNYDGTAKGEAGYTLKPSKTS